MTIRITLDSHCINHLDISPVDKVVEQLIQESQLRSAEPEISFEIDYPLDDQDPRELSEVPEVRLWFICLDSQYPWLPYVLDWRSGELARYVAMLVPHQFHGREGIQYNPEALEIFLMQKIFVITRWLQEMGLPSRSRLQSMAQMLGYDLDEGLFDVIEQRS
ncbi:MULTISPECIES: CRR6 family NdhI maturation factor [Limnospira]|uniref:CRR6 family NdhI maturation factor n=1 Tax=Limnospira fusiformis PMC 851.14 TaxID=2219512 RepID=A0ABU9EFT7_LIMFS|nr:MULTISPECIES: CRR6 family NdhI maturation factor [Limnospira]MDY7054343.1 CRR6 family NdhI maturation factor [Limnospira fusiformis LS22]QJB27583.1 CRR6 family NdhI maturation factor [Limnospira fusiformis SAG 85.79]MDT9188796.1 CRR6 family NdhI maturation factor [Limnospira sp. PMC 894.15]MDT9197074.1 CRR6 family NdhI maturation factor [Limnospira sp. PMC 1042.18]MDT9234572.1 CRR6 family NdhI maturation factor [Limnospira sp. PMC 917.15]